MEKSAKVLAVTFLVVISLALLVFLVYLNPSMTGLAELSVQAGDLSSPVVNLVSPSDAQTFNSTNNVTFNVSANDNFGLNNCTLWHNLSGSWQANGTKDGNGTSYNDTWAVYNIINGTYIWNVYCCDNSSNCAWNASNYTFVISYELNTSNISNTSNVSNGAFVLLQTLSTGDLNGPYHARAMAAGDIDGDDDVDLVMGGYDHGTTGTRVYKNYGNGTFYLHQTLGDADPISNCGTVLADVNNDDETDAEKSKWNNRHMDLLVTDCNQRHATQQRIYFNDGNGNFRAAKTLEQSYSQDIGLGADFGDVDNDGKLDLVLAGGYTDEGETVHNLNGRVYISRGRGNFVFSQNLSGNTSIANFADFDGDGYLDIITNPYTTDTSNSIIQIFKNDGSGYFYGYQNITTSRVGISNSIGDFDGDGIIDVAVSFKFGPSIIYRNNGSGYFSYYSNLSDIADGDSIRVADIAVGDFNNDGYYDLITSYVDEATQANGRIARIYMNNGSGYFSNYFNTSEVGSPRVITVADFNGDNKLDFAVGSYKQFGSDNKLRIYLNNLNITNTLPNPPSNLNRTNGSVILAWSGASDAETPNRLLNYNVRMGTTSGGNQIISGYNSDPFWGNAKENTRLKLMTLPPGKYYWSVSTIDSSLKISNSSAEQVFFILVDSSSQQVNITANSTYDVNATKNVDINISLLQNATGNISVVEYNVNPENVTASSTNGFAALGLNYFVSINVTDQIKGNISWYLLKINYSDSDISGVDESSLRIYYFNASSGQWQPEPDSGVNTPNNYVWANITHFSTFSIGGSAAPSTSSSGGGGGGGGSVGASTTIVPTIEGVEATIRKVIKSNLIVDSTLYPIRLVKTGTIDATFTINEAYYSLNLLDKTIDLDVNKDSKKDTTVILESVEKDQATFKFKIYAEPVKITTPLPEAYYKSRREKLAERAAENAVVEEAATPENITEQKETIPAKIPASVPPQKAETSKKTSAVIGILILLTLFAAVVLFILGRKLKLKNLKD